MTRRHQQYLRERYRLLLAYLGGIWMLVALTMLSPLLIVPFYPDEAQHAPAFLIVGIPLMLAGVMMRWRIRLREQASPTVEEGMVAIILAWLTAIVIGTVPFMLINGIDLTQALLESTSGWTTTGLSVLDVEAAPRIILFYRSVIQFIGGAGFAIIVLSSITGPVGSGISQAEGRDDQLAPHVRQSASIVLRIYVVYAVIGSVALAIAGMTPFDAVNHAFAALSTGGFSTRAASIGYWNNPAVEAVTIVLMLLGTINYLTAYLIWRRKFGAVSKNGEIRLMSFFLPVMSALILLSLLGAGYASFDRALRIALFEVTSALSTTGFSLVSYADWPDFSVLLLILVMLMGGGSGSTSGGIKQVRIYVLLIALYWEVRRAFLPKHAINKPFIWRGEQRVLLSDQRVRRTSLFVFLYMIMFFVGVLIFTAHNIPLKTAMFEMASTLSTVGLSLGVTSADAPATILWTEIIGMILGRLEFFALVIGSIKLFGDLRMMVRKPQAQA